MQSSRKLGLFTATLIGINSMVGAGIFTAPAKLATSIGPAALLTYLFVIFAVWCMAQSFGRLGELFPEAGSFWQYTRPWAGDMVGRIVSWCYLFGLFVAMGFLTKLAGVYLHDYFPQTPPQALSIAVLLGVLCIQIIGGQVVKATQYISICCTIFPLITIAGLCLTKATWSNLTPFAPFGFASALTAIPAVIFGFLGFETITTLSSVVENPQSTIPKALNYAVLCVGFVYVLFISAIFMAIPAGAFADASVPLSQPLKELFPDYHWLVNLIHASMTLAFLSVINAVTFALSRLVSALCNYSAPQHPTLLQRVFQWPPVFVICMVFFAFTILKTPDLFFAVAALLLMIPFLTSFITLLTLPRERTVVTYITCAMTVIVFCSAVYGVAQQLL